VQPGNLAGALTVLPRALRELRQLCRARSRCTKGSASSGRGFSTCFDHGAGAGGNRRQTPQRPAHHR
jgi:hypothetical protein